MTILEHENFHFAKSSEDTSSFFIPVCSSYLISVWGKKAPVPVHVLQLMFAVGQAVAPLLTKPFISKVNTDIFNSITAANSSTINFTSQVPHLPETNSPVTVYGNYTYQLNYDKPSPYIYVPFLLLGAYGCAISVIFVIFACKPAPQELNSRLKKKTFRELFSPKFCGDGDVSFVSLFLIGLFLVYFMEIAAMVALSTFIYPIAVNTKSLQFTSSSGSVVTTLFFTLGMAGRLFWAILSHFISIKFIAFCELTLQVVSFICLALFGLKSQLSFSILVCVCSFFMQPLYPALMAWSNRYIEVTGLVVAVIDTGIGIGYLLSSWISGIVYQRFGAQSILYFSLSCSAVVLAIAILMQVRSSYHGDRFNKKYAPENNDEKENGPFIS